MERKIKDRQVACSVLKPEWIHQGKKNRLSYLLNHPVFVKKKKPDTITTTPGVYQD